MESLLRCPLCAQPLDRQDTRYLCPRGHSFDRAAAGYVHLLPANKLHSKDPGDDKAMAAARNRFLSGGYYDPLRDALTRLALAYAPDRAQILDAGCGEGYYSAALFQALLQAGKHPRMAGVDLSKHALRRAAKRQGSIEFAVASVYDLPVADQQIDLLVNCFSPLALEEFLRVLGETIYGKQIEELGCQSLCIKDMAGLLTPYTCYELVKELKNTLSIPVDIHSHYTAGLASMSLLKGIEAGADIVDTAMSPLSGGTSHMATESLVAALQGTDYDTGLDLKQLNVVRAYFAKLREKYIANGQISPKSLGVDANTLLYQVPGGMFSNMLKQLKDAGKEDKLDEVLAEIPRVREDAGYPPLVTPTSQIVGTQAVFNVILGERYKMVTKEFKGLVHGDYGKTPAPISPEFTKKILGDEKPITCRFADTLAPEMDKLKAEAAKWATQEEDVLTYAMFPQVAPKFFEKRNAKAQGVDADHADFANKSHPV